jgi:hypothetical protein
LRANALRPAAVRPPRGSFSRADALRLRDLAFAMRLRVFLADVFFAFEDFDFEAFFEAFFLEVFFAAMRMLSTRLG